jgi:hypothetical protein
VIATNHPHLFDLKFCLIHVAVQDVNKIRQAMPKNLEWMPRVVNGNFKKELALRSVVIERSHENYISAESGATCIVRPIIGANLTVKNEWWLELTPALIKSAYQSKSVLLWLKKVVGRFGTHKIVVSSESPNPPAMRDLLSAVAVILDFSPNDFIETIRTNSKRLVDDLYEAC